MINYKDNKRALTAEELRHMYNLDDLKKDRKAISIHSNSLTKIEAEQENVLKSIIINLGDSIKNQSEITLWFFDGKPTLNNIPAANWNDYSEHLGDFYYDKSTGLAYKFVFNEDYLWQQQNDSSLIQALALTNSELDTIDNSRKVFFSIPTPPYDNGDWYIDPNYDLYICQISKPEGEIYNENDFIIASRYTDDTKANEIAGKLVIVSGQVTTIIQNLDLISQTIEDNCYYVDEKGEKHLISTSMSQLVQTVDEIKGEISDIADVTITVEGNSSIPAENINESEPIYIKVHPTSNENYSFLYPGEDLYPGENTFTKSRTLLFENTNDYSISYEIPNDLLYLDENTYDEFVLDYENKKCYIIHKVGINEDNENYKLTTETTEYFDYPTIALEEGDYTISTPSSENTYIYARLMTKNLYTSQFATQVEINAKIAAKSNEINLEVNQKVDNKDYTNAKITAIINDGTSAVKIKADRIDLTGYLTIASANSTYASKSGLSAGTTTINGGCITTGTIDASKVTVKNLNASNITSGTLTADKINGGTISASAINLGNGVCTITTSGQLTCSNIKATGGTIAGLTINSEAIFNGKGIGTAGSCGMSYNIDGWAFWAGNGAYRVTQAGKVICSDIEAIGGTVGGFSLGTESLTGATYKGTMLIKKGINAAIDLPANGGRLMLASTNTGNVALTTANKLVISDQYSHTDPGDSNATIGIRAINGHVRIASNHAISLVAPAINVSGYTGQTGQISLIGQSSSGQYEYYVAFKNGILVGVSRRTFSTSEFPWLV